MIRDGRAPVACPSELFVCCPAALNVAVVFMALNCVWFRKL